MATDFQQHVDRFRAEIAEDLDGYNILHKILGASLDILNKSNLAIFLPAAFGGGYAQAGYVNYTFSKENAELLLGIIEQHVESLFLPDQAPDDEIKGLLRFAEDENFISVPLMTSDQNNLFGVLVAWRPENEPFDQQRLESFKALAPVFSDRFEMVLAVDRLVKSLHNHGTDDRDGGAFNLEPL